MHKIIIITALAAFSAVPANAETSTAKETVAVAAELSTGPRSETRQQYLLDIASNEVPDLAAYGDRFQAAIRLLEAESAKPEWGWEDGCDHTGEPHDVVENW
jgi:hypothetical protein